MTTEITDEKLVKVYVKMRAERSRLAKEYKAADEALKEQQGRITGELLRRLNDRGSTQTKTEAGTAFIGEDMQVSIADEEIFRTFVLDAKDLNWYQKRVKIEHLREYMKVNGGRLPPGLCVFRERTILVRAPKMDGSGAAVEMLEFEEPNAAAAA